MSTIVCLVSRQAIPNVIPVLELKPDKVILLQSMEERLVAQNIKSLFEEKEFNVQIYPEYLDAYDLNMIKKICSDIIKNNEDKIILNVTGGTKVMAIAAYEIFNSFHKRIFYYDPVKHCITDVNSANPTHEKVNYQIDVRDYLKAHGYEILEDKTNSGRAENKKDFFDNLNKTRLNELIEFMNGAKQKIHLNTPNQCFNLNKFCFNKNYDKISIIDNLSKIKIAMKQSDFKFGDWLEDILFLIMKDKSFYDVRYGVKIIKNDINNEIDLLCTKNCKLYLYSCKDRKKNEKDDIFEIEVLKNITGGTFGKAHFIYTQENKNINKICKSLNIETKQILELL